FAVLQRGLGSVHVEGMLLVRPLRWRPGHPRPRLLQLRQGPLPALRLRRGLG
ncbi:unnamed protein product, partial [Effrenium voratum]